MTQARKHGKKPDNYPPRNFQKRVYLLGTTTSYIHFDSSENICND